MSFCGILWRAAAPAAGPPSGPPREPGCLRDLCLDQVLAAMGGSDSLQRIFRAPVDLETALYRQDLFRDLERAEIAASCRAFLAGLEDSRSVRRNAGRCGAEWSARRWRLDAARAYAACVRRLSGRLKDAAPRSEALRGLGAWLEATLSSEGFIRLEGEGERIARALDSIVYAVRIGDGVLTVSPPGDGTDYGARIGASFARFREGPVPARKWGYEEELILTEVEGKILGFVTALHPDVFGALAAYCRDFDACEDPVLTRLDGELRFAFAWLDMIAPLRAAGLAFCLPSLSGTDKTERLDGSFDLALALNRVKEKAGVVPNDFALSGEERIVIVTGPNQGGKTTFARMIGQVHYLAALGVPVPGRAARLFFADEVFTHFEREENARDLRSKLEDELVRIHGILARADGNSLVIMNESFNAAAVSDALALSAAVLTRFAARDLLCVCVTFLPELASLSGKIVTMVAQVDHGRGEERSFRVVRARPDGQVYAMALARKYRVTGADIRERLGGRA